MPASRPSANPSSRTVVADGPGRWQILGTLFAILAYIVLFYLADGRRRLFLTQLLVPDDLLASWVDGDWSRFGVVDHLPVLAGAALIGAVSGATGWLGLRALQVHRGLTRGETFVVSVTAGLNVWSLLTLALGLAGLLHARWLFLLLAVVASGTAAGWWWRDRRARSPVGETEGGRPGVRSDFSPLTRFGQLALAMTLPLGGLTVWGATLPATHFDVREYHLQVPKEWFQQGRVTFLPHNVYGNMPLGAEMHAVLGMILAVGEDDWWWGALIGKTVIAGFALLAAAAIYFFGRRFFSADAGAWGAFAFLSTPWIAHVSMTGLIDGAVACYVITAVGVGLISSRLAEEPAPANSLARWRFTAVAGFLAGGAVACKYPSLLFLVAPLGLLITFLPWGRIHGRDAVVFALAVVAGCGLWFGKNWVLAGNPTYPLLHSVFEGRSWSEDQNERWVKAHGPPRDATGRRYGVSQLYDSLRLLFLRSDHHGPWLVPLALAGWWGWRRSPWRGMLAVIYGLSLFAAATWWLATHRVDRFLVPILPLVALAAGVGAAWTGDRRWRRMIAGLGLFCGAASFAQMSTPFAADNRFLIGLSDLRSDRPRSDTESSSRMNEGHRWLNEHVPRGYRVLMVGEAQVFDLEVPILYNTCFDDCELEILLRDRSREERLRILREWKISHIFVSWYELDRYRSPGNYGYSDYPTRELFYEELVAQQGLLRSVPVGERQMYEIFEVIGVADSPPPDRNEAPRL